MSWIELRELATSYLSMVSQTWTSQCRCPCLCGSLAAHAWPEEVSGAPRNVIHYVLKHKHRLAQMNRSLSLCLDHTGDFNCLVQMLVSHYKSPWRMFTILMSLGTWAGISPYPTAQDSISATEGEEGVPAISSGESRGCGRMDWQVCLLGAGRGSVSRLILWSGAAVLTAQPVAELQWWELLFLLQPVLPAFLRVVAGAWLQVCSCQDSQRRDAWAAAPQKGCVTGMTWQYRKPVNT